MKLLFWGVLAAGFAGCTAFGIGPVLQRVGGNWLSVPMLVGSGLGLAIVALGVMFGFGIRPGLLASDGVMIGALVALIGVKIVVGLLA